MSSTGSGGNTNGNYPVSFSVLRELWCFAGRIGSSSLRTMEGDCLSCMKYLMFLFNFFIFVSIWNQLSILHPRVSSSLLLPSRTHCNLVKLPEDALSFALAITEVFFFFMTAKDAQAFSKAAQRSLLSELYPSLARETSGKAVTSGVRGLTLNGRRGFD